MDPMGMTIHCVRQRAQMRGVIVESGLPFFLKLGVCLTVNLN